MKTLRKMYTVRGSEDGILGVYSNVKNAYKKALNYVGDDACIEKYTKGDIKRVPATYSRVLKETIKELVGNGVRAEIEMFYLNQ